MALPIEYGPHGRVKHQVLSGERIRHGIGIMRVEPEDFKVDRRRSLVRAIERAYIKDQLLGPTITDLARRVGNALTAEELPMQEALRVHLGLAEDGTGDRQIKVKVAALANVVPSLHELVQWL